jgi:hypothetical protein
LHLGVIAPTDHGFHRREQVQVQLGAGS